MDLSAFTNPNGKFVSNKDGHKTFLPSLLPPKLDYDTSLASLLSEAHGLLGQLSGIGELLPNPDLLIRPYVTREAVLSSKIEGTQASIIDIFEFEAKAKVDSEEDGRRKRIQEVVNYVHALDRCINKIQKNQPITLVMIKDSHKTLLHNIRGQERTSGEFRKVQNWIGPAGSKIEDAVYVPPAPASLKATLEGVEKFIQQPSERIPVLVQCALIHYQFEAIHPFTDGNGRVGRLLIPLLLAKRRILSRPLLYLSAYFEKNKTEYYRHLLSVSQNSTWLEWVRFFLIGVIQQASDAITNIRKLMELRSKYEEKLLAKKASGNVIRLVDYLFSNPVVTITGASEYLDLTYPAAKHTVEYLKNIGILVEIGKRERNRMFRAQEIFKITANQ
jgi:Fic family protein